MKIKFKKDIIRETLNRLQQEITAKEVGLDSKRDTTESDDDLLSLISQKDIDQNPGYGFMLRNGYIPINRPAQKEMYDDKDEPIEMSSKLGEGVFGIVYEATKAGSDKRYAVKITDDTNEVRIREKLEDVRESLPEDVMRHIVKVEDIIQVESKQVSTYGTKKKFLIAMQLVRPMNKFESTALFQGVSALERMTADFNSKYLIKDPKIFKEIFKNRVGKLGIADTLMIHFTASRTAKGVKPKDKEKLEFADKAYDFEYKFMQDLINGLDDSMLAFWKESITNIVQSYMESGKTIDTSSYPAYYGYAAVQTAVELCKEIAKKDGKRYELMLKEMGLGNLMELGGPLEDYLFDRILNLSSQFELGMRNEWKDYLKNRMGKQQGEFKMSIDYGSFLTKLRVYQDEDKEKIREKFYDIAQDMPEKVRNFMAALMTLALDRGILWRDLHEGNVMVDPQTREYVAVDVGMFSTESKFKA